MLADLQGCHWNWKTWNNLKFQFFREEPGKISMKNVKSNW